MARRTPELLLSASLALLPLPAWAGQLKSAARLPPIEHVNLLRPTQPLIAPSADAIKQSLAAPSGPQDSAALAAKLDHIYTGAEDSPASSPVEPVAAAPASEGSDEPISSRLRLWESTLRRYNYRALFDMTASEFPASSPERTLLARRRDDFLSPAAYGALPPRDDYRDEILGLLDTDFSNEALPRAITTRSLDWFLSTYLPHGPTTLAPLPQAPAPRPEDLAGIERGYSSEVRAIAKTAPHSIADLDAYLALQTGAELSALLGDPATALAFIDADRTRAQSIVAALGYPRVYQVNAAGYSRRRETLLGHDPVSGRVILAEYGFSSDEQLLNHQARMYLLRRSAPEKKENIFVLRARADDDFPDRADFERFLDRLGAPPEIFVAGFTNPLKKILENPRQERIGRLQLITGRLPGGPNDKPRLAIGLSGFGASYGALPAKIMKILAERGLEAVVFLGTAGGIADPLKRFAWVTPDRVFSAGAGGPDGDGPVLLFDNRAAKILDSAVTHCLHATVFSPLMETRKRIREFLSRRVASVDCELAHVIAAAAAVKRPLAIYAALSVTDFPLSGVKSKPKPGGLSLENSAEQYAAVTAALAQIAADLAVRRR